MGALKVRHALAAAIVVSILAASVFVVQQRLTGVVAVVRVSGYILTSGDADYYTALLRRAYNNDSVKAVVLVIDSFGGSADYVEQVYYSVKQLKTRKPVVALAVNALSGGYYIAVAADYIFAHSTSLIGSIGVIATAPPLLIPSEYVLETGPYKHTGFSRLHFFSNLSRALDSFVSAVEEGRGQRLRATREELKKALVYLGVEALELGLVDRLGSLEQAVEEAARRAGLLRYSVVELQLTGASKGLSYAWWNVTVSLLESLHPPPALYYVYLPATQLQATTLASAGPVTGGGSAIIDLSHGNLASWWSLNALLAELALRNVTFGFYDTWDRVVKGLENATCLIVATPTRPYSEDEVKRVEEFVRRGGVLLLIYDPAYEFLGPEALRNFVVAPINSLASRFGVTFAYGYLYSLEEYYGIYRNVYVRSFANITLFRGVGELVLFTAAPLRSSSAVAWANNTHSTAAEKPGNYPVVALVRWGNGTVVAIGDTTVFMEPYCHVSDNYKFVSNLAELIANATLAPAPRPDGFRIERPNLPVGTVKVFRVDEDGEVYELRWTRVSEGEVVVETPYYTTVYIYEGGSLKEWRSDGVECVYDQPLPEPPFPLTEGKSWSYSTGFTLTMNDARYRGWLTGRETVEGFESVKALDGRTYFCARVSIELTERLTSGGVTVITTTRGYYWLSSEAGTVKQSTTTSRSYSGYEAGTSSRELILKELRRP
ncbi:MAG: S49 family peptidase [Thermofilaceae archaeon]